jgi:hypothetical protein
MALLIEKNTKILGLIDVSTLYVRMALDYRIEGDKFEIFNQVYPSKTSYDNGLQKNTVKIDGIPFNLLLDYDRAEDGADLLTAAHNKLKDVLSTDITKEEVVKDPSTGKIIYIQEPVLDPSTGEQMTDPSTGELLWTDGDPSTAIVVVTPKFAEDSSIFIIDIDQ